MSKNFVYIEKKAELESILEELQSPNLDLDDTVLKYRQGVKLIEEIEHYLTNTKNTILEIKNNLKK